jgi:hypothetical protein
MSPRSQKHDDEGEEQPQKDHVVMKKKLDDRHQLYSAENAKIIPDAGKVYLGTFLVLFLCFYFYVLACYFILVDFCSCYLLAIGVLLAFFFLNNLFLLVTTTNSIYFLKPFSRLLFLRPSYTMYHYVMIPWCRRPYSSTTNDY